jgi:hypothetical protein
MNIIIDLVFPIIGVSTFYLLFFRSKTNKKFADGTYPFQKHSMATCPMCGAKWNARCDWQYCDCDEHYEGHFHCECDGVDSLRLPKSQQMKLGCGFKWIMRIKK